MNENEDDNGMTMILKMCTLVVDGLFLGIRRKEYDVRGCYDA